MSNLRSKAIRGFVTDSAGNVLRNRLITIKELLPSGAYVIDTSTSDDTGYFESAPLPNGTYNIFESGITVGQVIHRPDQSSIPCYSPDSTNIPDIVPFSVCLANNDLNSFKTYLQIEPADLDVSVYGHYFPVYGVDAVSGYSAALDHIKTFFSLNSSNPYGRVTTTRFNIEYYNPLTSSNSIYKRVRWVGVPGLQFYVNHKLVVPLDYRSIVLSYYTKGYFAYTSGFPVLTTDGSSPNMVCTITFLGDPNFATIYNEVNLGDIIEVTAGAGAKFFGIVRSTSLESSTIIAEQWKSTRYSTTMSSSTAVTGFAYHNAMFPGIININQLVYDRFSVTENMEVQNSVSELDLYS